MKYVMFLCLVFPAYCGDIKEYPCDWFYDRDDLDITWDDRHQLVEKCLRGEPILINEEMKLDK